MYEAKTDGRRAFAMRDTGLLGFDRLIALPTFGEPGTDIGSTWCLDPPTGGEAGLEYGENARL